MLGPSGSGKSTLARWIKEDFDFEHIEVDRWPGGDGIDLEGLRTVWNCFWTGADAHPLAAAVNARVHAAGLRGATLSFPSGVVFTDEHLAAAERAGIRSL